MTPILNQTQQVQFLTQAAAALNAYLQQLNLSLKMKCSEIAIDQLPVLKSQEQASARLVDGVTLTSPSSPEKLAQDYENHDYDGPNRKSPVQQTRRRTEQRMMNKMNILREQVSRKIVTFIEALSLASVQLGSSSTKMGIKGAVETLSKVRIQGHGRVCNGLILLDQQFTTP